MATTISFAEYTAIANGAADGSSVQLNIADAKRYVTFVSNLRHAFLHEVDDCPTIIALMFNDGVALTTLWGRDDRPDYVRCETLLSEVMKMYKADYGGDWVVVVIAALISGSEPEYDPVLGSLVTALRLIGVPHYLAHYPIEPTGQSYDPDSLIGGLVIRKNDGTWPDIFVNGNLVDYDGTSNHWEKARLMSQVGNTPP